MVREVVMLVVLKVRADLALLWSSKCAETTVTSHTRGSMCLVAMPSSMLQNSLFSMALMALNHGVGVHGVAASSREFLFQ